MGAFSDALRDSNVFEAVTRDCAQVVREEIASKSGLTGAVLRTALSLVENLRPDFVETAVHSLLPEFAHALDPFAERARAHGVRVASELTSDPGSVVEALLEVGDRRITEADHAAIGSVYRRLRGTARVHVLAALPAIARIVDAYV